MRTLDDERRATLCDAARSNPPVLRHCEYWHGVVDALGPYAEWRVVEGELRAFPNVNGLVDIMIIDNVGGGISRARHLGAVGDHVKIIIPPEEPKSDPLEDQMRERIGVLEQSLAGAKRNCKLAWSDAGAADARADKYERALREIADHPSCAGGVAHSMRIRAKEALE